MQSEIETAIKRAACKLGAGLLLLAALIGVRIVTATPAGIESEIAELERLESATAQSDQQASDPSVPDTAEGAEESGSLLSRLRPGGRPSSAGAAAPDGERLVSCELGGGVQFMRGADCATRGGRATDLD